MVQLSQSQDDEIGDGDPNEAIKTIENWQADMQRVYADAPANGEPPAANGERQRITGLNLSSVLAGLPPTHAETKMLTTNSIREQYSTADAD